MPQVRQRRNALLLEALPSGGKREKSVFGFRASEVFSRPQPAKAGSANHMANTPKADTQNQGTTAPTGTKGRRILKHGMLAAPSAVKIDGVPAIGNFGKLDVPLVIDGQRFLLPLSQQNPEHEALLQAFGDYARWNGATVRVSDGKMLKQVSIVPVADANGKPAQ